MKTPILLAALILASTSTLTAAERKPNVLFIAVDDMNNDLGCYGDPLAQTPTLDRLAKEGVLYERCFLLSPSAHRRDSP